MYLFASREFGYSVNKKFSLVFKKVFSFYLREKTFSRILKFFEMLYYLLIISNLILKFLIVICFV